MAQPLVGLFGRFEQIHQGLVLTSRNHEQAWVERRNVSRLDAHELGWVNADDTEATDAEVSDGKFNVRFRVSSLAVDERMMSLGTLSSFVS